MRFPFMRHLAGLVCASVFPLLCHAEFEALSALQNTGARVSAVAIDLQTGRTLGAVNSGTRLSPASITKLVVAAKALDTWPSDKTFATRLYAMPAPVAGVIEGDLILATEGDASLDHKSLIALAAQLRSRGITRINGNIVASTTPFGALSCETKDRCEALSKSSTAYNAPIAGIGVDYGAWCIEVRPGAVNRPASVTSCEGIPLPISVEGSITTLSARKKTGWWVDRRTFEGEDRLMVGGSVPAGEPQIEYRAMSEPARGAALLLRETLRTAGIRVQGNARVTTSTVPLRAVEVARIDSLPLREQLGRMLRFSNNYLADVLTMNLAAWRGESTITLADASQGLAQHVALGGVGRGEPPLLFSGSGLTPENHISAGEMAAMLAMEHRNAANFSSFYGSLVVPRYSPSRGIRNGSENWLDRVAMKTGTMSEPVSVCALAGYLRKQDGGFIAFAIMVNGGPQLARVPHYKAMEAIKADIDALLLRY